MNKENTLIENTLAAFVPGGIERQEKKGQVKLTANSELPKCGDWDLLKQWGIRIIKEKDELFYDVSLPSGWYKEETDHHMRINLKDSNDLIRASIFYKAAFYDRRADITPIKSRWVARQVFDKSLAKNELAFAIFDNGLKQFASPVVVGELGFSEGVPGGKIKDWFYCHPENKATTEVALQCKKHLIDFTPCEKIKLTEFQCPITNRAYVEDWLIYEGLRTLIETNISRVISESIPENGTDNQWEGQHFIELDPNSFELCF